MSEEIQKIWEALHALEERLDSPMCGPMIEDDHEDDGIS